MHKPSTRAQIITRRTYNRPLNEEGTKFESWELTTARVIKHQRWLWERALTQKEWPDMPLNDITCSLNLSFAICMASLLNSSPLPIKFAKISTPTNLRSAFESMFATTQSFFSTYPSPKSKSG